MNAFSIDASVGGLIGSLIAGVKRAVFSNESGIGSAPIAYAPAKSDNHLNTGFMSLLSPVVDTIIVCSMTALVIVITGVYENDSGIQGVELTSRAFQSVFSWFPTILAIAITLFAISTLITWSYYGLRCWTYLFGIGKISKYSFKLIFLSFTVIGTSMNLESVINFSDSMIFAMSVPNIIGLYFLSSELKKDITKLRVKIKMEKIVIASDHAGFELKKIFIDSSNIKSRLLDLGPFSSESVDYPDYAKKLSLLIQNNEYKKGVLICGSGIGMSMVANRFDNVRAALCMNHEMARLSRQHNNANILVLGSRLISAAEAIKCLIVFLDTNYEGGRHQARLDKFNLVG